MTLFSQIYAGQETFLVFVHSLVTLQTSHVISYNKTN